MTDYIRCLYCQKVASVTITSEVRGMLAHWPTCEDHVERAARQMRSERGRERVGRDPFSGELSAPAVDVTTPGPLEIGGTE